MVVDRTQIVSESRSAGTSGKELRFGKLQFGLSYLLAAVALIGVLLIIGMPIYRHVQRDSERRQCESRLHQIAIALGHYHDKYGQYPPVHVVGTSGLPEHSWRVLLLPFLDSTAAPALAKYSFAEPWNGPNNTKLRKHDLYFTNCPQFFRCPGDQTATSMTSYVAVVGPHTMWPNSLYMRTNDVRKGLGNTILIVEVANSDIEWLEPRDLSIANLHNALQAGRTPALLDSHESAGIQGGIVVFADGHTEFLPHSISEQQLLEMLSAVDRPRH